MESGCGRNAGPTEMCNQSQPVDEGSGGYPDKKCYSPVLTLLQLDDLGPGATRLYEYDLDVTDRAPAPAWTPGQITNLYVSPNLYYSDVNDTYHDQPSFETHTTKKGIFAKGQIFPRNVFDRLPIQPH